MNVIIQVVHGKFVNLLENMKTMFFVEIIFLLLLTSFNWPDIMKNDPIRTGSVNALYYNNRNECNSLKVDYDFHFEKDHYVLRQDMWLVPTRTVTECFFYMDMDFELFSAELKISGTRAAVVLEFMNDYFIVRIVNGIWMMGVEHQLFLRARRPFKKADEGIVFRTYRHPESLMKSWYAIVKVPGMNCGKVVICVNNFVDLIDFSLTVHYPNTHTFFCAGKQQKKINENSYIAKSTCDSEEKRNPNDFQFAVGQFVKIQQEVGESTYSFITVPGVSEKIPEDMLDFWNVTKKMSLRLASFLGDLYQPHRLHLYMLPNFDIDRPVIKHGYCYFSPAMLVPGSTKIYTDLLHCLLRQGAMLDRQFESWNMIWGFEGLLELLIGKFSMPPYLMRREDFSDCLDGGPEDLANLADLTSNVQDAQVHRPVRKSAGFWKMLQQVNKEYANVTYRQIYQDTTTTSSYDSFLKTITESVHLLNLTRSEFTDMLYSWAAPKGFPVIEAFVYPDTRKVCVWTYNYGQENYIGRYILPFKISPRYPYYPDSKVVWTHLTRATCLHYSDELYPYLINRDMSVVARILYDEENLLTWIDVLANKQTSNILTYDQKLSLVNDIFFFATNNRLDYMIALHYVQLLRTEVDERLWVLFDKMVAGLDAKARYTRIYNAFTQYIGDVMAGLYEESVTRNTTSMVAIKWSCFMNMLACKDLTQHVVYSALLNHQEHTLQFEYMCAGIRKVGWEFFEVLMNSFGQPDWKEPYFYVEILACAEDRRILRALMLHMFYLDSWNFSASILTNILLTMIRMGKTGSDVVFWYLDHDPLDMLEQLKMVNLLTVVDELANYVQYTDWLDRVTRRMHLKKVLDSDNERRLVQIKIKIRENKRWMNRSYQKFQEHVYEQFSKYVLKSDG